MHESFHKEKTDDEDLIDSVLFLKQKEKNKQTIYQTQLKLHLQTIYL